MTTRRRPFCALVAIRYIPSPPSTSSTAPVMNDASSEQRNRTAPATSSGSPSRPSGVFCEHRVGRLLGQDVGQLRLHVAGNDDVRADVPAAELARERLREADDPGLRRRVVRLPPVPVDADDRGDVHDRPRALLHHPARRRAARVEARREVRVDDGVPVLVRHADEQPVARDAGVVHEDVEIARLLDERARRLRIGDVRLHGAAADLGGERLGLVRAGAIRERRPTRPPAASSVAIARPIPLDAPVTSAVRPSSEQNACVTARELPARAPGCRASSPTSS